mmetsp:Transcript_43176/g.107671  ORF Transcript_43176/g.107671 Transcript_43176/m.107671 type:complete len:92 (+) Transcript_43176:215-490(+)
MHEPTQRKSMPLDVVTHSLQTDASPDAAQNTEADPKGTSCQKPNAACVRMTYGETVFYVLSRNPRGLSRQVAWENFAFVVHVRSRHVLKDE